MKHRYPYSQIYDQLFVESKKWYILAISWYPDILLKGFKSFPWFESHNKSMTLKHE